MGSTQSIALVVNGRSVTVDGTVANTATLLDVLRDELRLISVKDGCSPQGQCGCCTVLVDGAPRVSCVTPVRRVRDRAITTLEGLPDDLAKAWADSFASTGGSQCGSARQASSVASKDYGPKTGTTMTAGLRPRHCKRTCVAAPVGSLSLTHGWLSATNLEKREQLSMFKRLVTEATRLTERRLKVVLHSPWAQRSRWDAVVLPTTQPPRMHS